LLEFAYHLGFVAAIYAVLSLSLNFQAGTGGLLNFGHVAFFGIGAYATGLTFLAGWPAPIGVMLGWVFAGLAGLGLAKLGRTLTVEYWAIASLALAETLRIVLVTETWIARGPHGISGIPGFFSHLPRDQRQVAILLLGASVAVICYVVVQYLTTSQFGRILRVLREQPELAMAMGHDIVTAKAKCSIVAGVIAATAGSLYTHYISYVGPEQLFPVETFLVWTMIVVGGLGNHKGAIIGAVIVYAIYIGTRFVNIQLGLPLDRVGGIRMVFIGILLLTVLLVRQGGLLPEPVGRHEVGR
jgi:branched-chain amino acid transport system permease protein